MVVWNKVVWRYSEIGYSLVFPVLTWTGGETFRGKIKNHAFWLIKTDCPSLREYGCIDTSPLPLGNRSSGVMSRLAKSSYIGDDCREHSIMGSVFPFRLQFSIKSLLVILIEVSLAVISHSKKPHIVFILADDLGFNDIGYHNSKIKTEVLDELAHEGVRLENYYVQPICTPTRAQLLTGRYDIHTGLQHGIIWPSQANALPKNETTIAAKLKESGYKTHIVGKWHVGFYRKEFIPTRRGFDSFYGFLTGGQDYYTHVNRLGFHKPGYKFLNGYDFWRDEEVLRDVVGEYTTILFAKEAVRIIKEHDPKKPLFLFLSFQAPHMPLQVPKRFLERYNHIKDHNRRIYAAMVSCMDEAIGNVTRTLKERGLWEDTVMIFSSDNGGQVKAGGNNWPLRGWKASLWEGGIRTVGFVHSQLIQKPQRIYRGLMHVSDWFPTLAHLAQAPVEGLPLDGNNQWMSISEGTPSLRKEVLHNIDSFDVFWGTPDGYSHCSQAALRRGDWKLLLGCPGNGDWVPPAEMSIPTQPSSDRHSEKSVFLFNITNDPEERKEISERHPDVVRDLLARIQMYNATAVPARFPDPDPNSNPSKHGGVWKPWVN